MSFLFLSRIYTPLCLLCIISRQLNNPTTSDPHELVYMAVRKAGLIKAKVTMVCNPPPPRHFLSVYRFSVSFCSCLPGPLGLDKLPPTPPPCPLTA